MWEHFSTREDLDERADSGEENQTELAAVENEKKK